MEYNLTFNKLPSKNIVYDSDLNVLYYEDKYCNLRVNKANNNKFFVFKIPNNNMKDGTQKVHISLSKILYAIHFNIKEISEIEDYQGIFYDEKYNEEVIINTLNEFQSFASCKNKDKINEIDGEIWKQFNELQYVSNLGRIKNIFDREIICKENKEGYLEIRTPNRNYKRVHQIVLETFLPLTDEQLKSNIKYEPNHKDYNRKNNKLVNLEWVSRSENIRHSFLNPNRKDGKKLRGNNYKLN